MRFAYIDSQGSEVPIPSVDALALRIELGAIGPDTELYDANEDRWGPAHTHEIFHTLSRGAEEGRFVAPPPPVPPPGMGLADEDEEPPHADEEASPDAEDEPAVELAAEPTVALAEAAEGEEPDAEREDEGGGDFDFGLTLADAPGADFEETPAAASKAPEAPAGGGEDEAAPFGFDIAADLAGEAAPLPEDKEDEEAQEEDSGFDFGGMGSLELESAEEPEEPAQVEEPGPSAEMEVERPMAFGGGMDEAEDFGGGLDLEKPMAEFTADAPPAWMEEQEGPGGGGDDSLDFSRPAAVEEPTPEAVDTAGEEPHKRERPEPRSRPSPPRRKRSFPVGAVVGVVLVGAVGYGAWYGWGLLQARRAASPARDATLTRPTVVIPDIPAELLPQMRDLGEAALGDMIGDLQALRGRFDLPAQPRSDWLAGIYLANASQYPDIEEYWLGIEAFVDSVRAIDAVTFHERYVARVGRARVPEDTGALLVERADSGFLATADDRIEAYAQLDDLVNAALDLHEFLLANEEGIVHEPASTGVSRDPLLEAVPDDPEVGRQMTQYMGRIADALAELGTLDRVTTERLTAVLFDRIRSAGFR